MNGLVLCAGKSSRMGQDKALIQYHGLPQYEYMAGMLLPFCGEVFISASVQQAEKMGAGFTVIHDAPAYAGAGPISGLLSAIAYQDNKPWLVIGCDYPHLDAACIQLLINADHDNADAVCFKNNNNGFLEPLVALYKPGSFARLQHYFAQGNQSLRHFLHASTTKIVLPAYDTCLKSVDTLEEYRNFETNNL